MQDSSTIEHQQGPSGDLYAIPWGEKGKGEKKEEEAGQNELTEEEKAALYSIPDKKRQANGEEVSVFIMTLIISATPFYTSFI